MWIKTFIDSSEKHRDNEYALISQVIVEKQLCPRHWECRGFIPAWKGMTALWSVWRAEERITGHEDQLMMGSEKGTENEPWVLDSGR